MEERFDVYFREEINTAFLRHPLPQYTYIVDHLDAASSTLGLHLRSDARYLIVTNIVNMVLMPIYRHHYERFDTPFPPYNFPEEQFLSDITSDIDMILREAAHVAGHRERSYISGTTILKALGNIVDGLKITGLQIWGPREA